MMQSSAPKLRRFRPRSFSAGDDLIFATVVQALSVLLSFGVQSLLAHNVSKELVGDYYFVVAIAAIASMAMDFGIAAVVIPRTAQAGTVVLPIIRVALRLRLIFAAVVLLFVPLGVALFYGSRMSMLVFLALAVTAFGGRSVGIRTLFELGPRISGRIYVVNLLGLLDLALQVALMLVLFNVFDLCSVETTLVVGALSAVPGFVMLMLPQVRRIWSVQITEKQSRRIARTMLRTSLPILVLGLIGQFSAQLETFVLDFTSLDRTAVAAYGAATRPVVASLFIANSISVVLLPFVSRAFRNRGEAIDLDWLVSFGGRLLAVLSLMIILGTWGLSEVVMLKAFGEQYVHDSYIMAAYAWINALVFLVIVGDQILIATNRRTRALGGAVLQLVIALPLELLLVNWLGLWGLLIGKGAAYVVLVIYQMRFYPGTLGSSQSRGLVRLLPAVLLLAGAQYWFGLHPSPLVAAAVAVAVLGVLAVSRVLTPSEIVRFRRMRLA